MSNQKWRLTTRSLFVSIHKTFFFFKFFSYLKRFGYGFQSVFHSVSSCTLFLKKTRRRQRVSMARPLQKRNNNNETNHPSFLYILPRGFPSSYFGVEIFFKKMGDPLSPSLWPALFLLLLHLLSTPFCCCFVVVVSPFFFFLFLASGHLLGVMQYITTTTIVPSTFSLFRRSVVHGSLFLIYSRDATRIVVPVVNLTVNKSCLMYNQIAFLTVV